jgi:hypothetical protein
MNGKVNGGAYNSMNLSLYAYGANNPVKYVDLDGEAPSEGAYVLAAKALGVEVNAIKAVYQVETGGNAFRQNGDPKVLFERHKFSKHTKGKFDISHPTVSNKNRGGYGKFSKQIGKLNLAISLDEDSGYKSASYGGFQIMGENYKEAGFKNAKSLALALMSSDEDKHLEAFGNFVNSNTGMKKDLQNKNWSGFARKYNGPKYKENDYDQKMKQSYADIGKGE